MKVRWLGSLTRDPSLKGVSKLTEEDGARKFARALAAALHLPESEIAITPIKQRIGQRAVLRIDAGEGARFYVKFLRGEGGEGRAKRLEAIARTADRAGVRAPLPVAWLPRYRALVTADLGGTPLLESGDPDSLASLGRALAGLHRELPGPTLVRGRAFERSVVGSVLRARSFIRPEPDPPLQHEAERWIESEPEESERFASLHGDLYPDQVMLLPEDRFGILDWDNACLGEPERDAGNFIAHLLLEEERGALRRARYLIDAFLWGYLSAGDLRPSVLDWYTIGSLLRIALLHMDPAFGSRPPNDPELPTRLLRRSRDVARGEIRAPTPSRGSSIS